MTTATITISRDDAPAGAVDRVKEALRLLVQQNPNWNGATFDVEHGDFTSVEYSGTNHGEELMPVIYRAIDNE